MSHRAFVARTAATVGSVVATSILLAVGAVPAGAHAILDLADADAVVGRTSAMTLEVQHGCITGGGGTVGVVATFTKVFGPVTAGAVPGWTAVVAPAGSTGDGRSITWTTTGVAQPFATPLLLPLTVRWPERPGTYGIAVTQTCSEPTGETTWDTRYQPATAGVPSPPITPLAAVCVLPRRLAGAATPEHGRAVRKVCATER